MAYFVDEIEIDKIRNTAEVFPFMAKFVFFFVKFRNRFGLILLKKKAKKPFFITYGFFSG